MDINPTGRFETKVVSVRLLFCSPLPAAPNVFREELVPLKLEFRKPVCVDCADYVGNSSHKANTLFVNTKHKTIARDEVLKDTFNSV